MSTDKWEDYIVDGGPLPDLELPVVPMPDAIIIKRPTFLRDDWGELPVEVEPLSVCCEAPIAETGLCTDCWEHAA